MKGIPDDSEDEDDDHDMQDEDGSDEDAELSADPGPSTIKEKKKKDKKGKKAAVSSDEESASEEEEEGWGRSKAAYYSSNAGQLESDDEEANEMEEQEAKRLQAKARDAMTDEDFGLEDMVDRVPEADEYVCVYIHEVYVLILPAAPLSSQQPRSYQNCLKTNRPYCVTFRKQIPKPCRWRETGMIRLAHSSRHRQR